MAPLHWQFGRQPGGEVVCLVGNQEVPLAPLLALAAHPLHVVPEVFVRQHPDHGWQDGFIRLEIIALPHRQQPFRCQKHNWNTQIHCETDRSERFATAHVVVQDEAILVHTFLAQKLDDILLIRCKRLARFWFGHLGCS